MVVLRRYTPSTKKKEQMESEKSVISISIATHEDKKWMTPWLHPYQQYIQKPYLNLGLLLIMPRL